MIKTVNIRLLKDKLSAYLRQVRHGDVVLVSDRGTVIAEIRQPTMHGAAVDASQDRLQRLVDAGTIKLGLPNKPDAYGVADVHVSADVIDGALSATRGE